jgi:hypothetical protein
MLGSSFSAFLLTVLNIAYIDCFADGKPITQEGGNPFEFTVENNSKTTELAVHLRPLRNDIR